MPGSPAAQRADDRPAPSLRWHRALALSLAVILPACGPQTYADSDPAATETGIVFDIGGKDDRSFNAAAWSRLAVAIMSTCWLTVTICWLMEASTAPVS